MKKIVSLAVVLMLLVPMAFVLCACEGKQGPKGEQGTQGLVGPALNFDLNATMVREQRASKRFYKVGSALYEEEEPEYGHMGTEATGAVTVTGDTIRVKTSPYATALAFNVANVFGHSKLEELKMWAHAHTSPTYVELTTPANFHVYTTVDTGWGEGHKPAYFVVNAPAEGAERIIIVDVLHNGKFSTFNIVIERAIVHATGITVVDNADKTKVKTTVKEGDVLGATVTLSSGKTIPTTPATTGVTYKWHYKGETTSLGTASTYTVKTGDVGKQIALEVKLANVTFGTFKVADKTLTWEATGNATAAGA